MCIPENVGSNSVLYAWCACLRLICSVSMCVKCLIALVLSFIPYPVTFSLPCLYSNSSSQLYSFFFLYLSLFLLCLKLFLSSVHYLSLPVMSQFSVGEFSLFILSLSCSHFSSPSRSASPFYSSSCSCFPPHPLFLYSIPV